MFFKITNPKPYSTHQLPPDGPFFVWTYKHAVYQRFNQSSYRPNVDQSRVRDSLSEIKFLLSPCYIYDKIMY